MSRVDNKDFLKQLKRIQDNLPNVVEGTLDALANIAVTNARSTILFKNGNPPRLRNEIRFVTNGAFSRVIESPTPYAKYVEYGNNQNGPIIRAKNKKALRFVINGQVLFRKFVRAHGPRPYMKTAYNTMMRFIPSLMERQIARLIDGI